jgi:superfamily II DNA or RNA helicase
VNIDKELFKPLAKHSTSLDCMTAFFTSGYLSELALALSAYLASDETEPMKLLIGPVMSEDDLRSLKSAITKDHDALEKLFGSLSISENSLRNYAIRALGYLVAKSRIELRVALQSRGIFHSKVWLFATAKGPATVHGSANATFHGLSQNTEHLQLNRSWRSDEGKEVCEEFRATFDYIWEGLEETIETLPLNGRTISALEKLAKEKPPGDSPDIAKKLTRLLSDSDVEKPAKSSLTLIIPSYINYREGPYAHQGKAVLEWFRSDCQGILSIATGGGKTITSLIAAAKLNAREKKLLTVVTVPTTPLVDQWSRDVEEFGVSPRMASSRAALKKEMSQAARALRHGRSRSEVLVITHDAAVSGIFDDLSKKLGDTKTLLIGDEVHNLGRRLAQENLPRWIDFRIGLSATYERQFDAEGNEFLRNYFGKCVFEFGLGEAIGNCLVPYDYFPRLIYLTAEEEEEVLELTAKIKRLAFAVNEEAESSSKGKLDFLLRQRRVLIEIAARKYDAFSKDLDSFGGQLSKAMVFCTDKAPEQLVEINSLLSERGYKFHQVTGEETASKATLNKIVTSFIANDLQVLTSKRVLDEGFNAPQTETAFFLASRTGKRQWIQRLGRVLRISPTTNKTKATIFDYVAIPQIQSPVDKDMSYLLKSEYARVSEFAKNSSNYLADGAGYEAEMKLHELMEAL